MPQCIWDQRGREEPGPAAATVADAVQGHRSLGRVAVRSGRLHSISAGRRASGPRSAHAVPWPWTMWPSSARRAQRLLEVDGARAQPVRRTRPFSVSGVRTAGERAVLDAGRSSRRSPRWRRPGGAVRSARRRRPPARRARFAARTVPTSSTMPVNIGARPQGTRTERGTLRARERTQRAGQPRGRRPAETSTPSRPPREDRARWGPRRPPAARPGTRPAPRSASTMRLRSLGAKAPAGVGDRGPREGFWITVTPLRCSSSLFRAFPWSARTQTGDVRAERTSRLPSGIRSRESKTTRGNGRGTRGAGSSRGSSASTVPMPTATASWRRRSRRASRRCAGPVIHLDSPRAVASRPSRVAAAFNVT
jgi:hypothetical protein